MPILNKNEKYTRELSDRIAVMTGLSSSAVRAVIDGIELCLLDDLRAKGKESGVDEKSVILLEIPNLGTLKMHTTKYPKEMSVMLDGRSFKSTFTINKKFYLFIYLSDFFNVLICFNFTNIRRILYITIINIYYIRYYIYDKANHYFIYI